YLKPSRFIKLDEKMVKSIEKTLKKLKIPYSRCTTWTTDAIFRETTSMIEYRKSEGCGVVEMECSALAAVAEFRKAKFGQLLFMADSLIDSQNHDTKNWGRELHEKLPPICLEIISDM
ncbi:MAG: phosphorylase, partial [Clostridia bacterium]|nr:phosphorylase [Clostridia bacterium]